MLESYEPEVEYDFDPRNIPAEYLQAIGLATASAAHAEEMVLWAITGLLGTDLEYGVAIAAHMTAPLRDNVIKAVAEIAIDDLDKLDELDQILDKISEAQTRRNKLVHRSWALHPDGRVMLVSQTARGSVNVEADYPSLESIREDAAFIYSSGIELLGFLLSVDMIPPPPPVGRARSHKTKVARKKRRKRHS